MPIAAGTRLGPYEIVSLIGAGGMGEVFKARDTRLERSVAIKIVSREFAERFEREAKTISQLNHPHICTLHDIGHENGTSFLVMELLEGDTLAERIARGPLPLAEVVRLGAQIAEALDRAHRSGIVHRDLKPGNVMLTKSGAKLLDFGLAKDMAVVAQTGVSVLRTEKRGITEEGTILGTFQYMAPEQLEGLEADARTDIFAFGAVLYEMATGRRAFEGKTRTSLIAAIVDRDPTPISQIQPLTPPLFEHVVKKCLEKDPDARWQSAHDIAEELKWIGDAGARAGAAPLFSRRAKRERLLWGAAIVLALIAGVIATRLFHKESAREYRFAIPMAGRGYALGGGRFDIAPDGETIYFRARGADNVLRLYKRALREAAAQPIEGTDGAWFFDVSADGEWIAFTRSGRLDRISTGGGPAETLYDGVVTGGAAGYDNTFLGVLPDGAIYALRSGQKPVKLTVVDRNKGDSAHGMPVPLPDRKRFLFIAKRSDRNQRIVKHGLCIGSIESANIRRLGDITSRVQVVNGRIYYVREGTLVSAPFDLENGTFSGEAVAIAGNVANSNREASANFAVADDGTIAFTSPPETETLAWISLQGTRLGTLGAPGSYSPAFRFAPDGNAVAVAVQDPRTGTHSLWSFATKRPTHERLTTSFAWETFPVYSPDGRKVYYSSEDGGSPDIFEAPVDGNSPPRRIAGFPNALDHVTDVSPDGKLLLFATTLDGTGFDIYGIALNGGAPVAVVRTNGSDHVARFSPDGKWISYVSDVTGRNEVYVKRYPGSSPARQISIGGGDSSHWSRDGRRLFLNRRRTIFATEVGPDGPVGEPSELFTLDQRLIGYEPHPAGDRFLAIVADDADMPPVQVVVGWRPPGK